MIAALWILLGIIYVLFCLVTFYLFKIAKHHSEVLNQLVEDRKRQLLNPKR